MSRRGLVYALGATVDYARIHSMRQLGVEPAFASGVWPFVIGVVLKSLLAVAVVKLAEPRVRGLQS